MFLLHVAFVHLANFDIPGFFQQTAVQIWQFMQHMMQVVRDWFN